MPEDTTQPVELARLLDRQGIWDCAVRYARAVDRIDEQAFRSCFWDDAYDAYGPVNGTPQEFLAYWLPQQHLRESCQHFLSNQRVEFDGDHAADAETAYLAMIKSHDAPEIEIVAGRYIDRFEKHHGTWRIRTRLIVRDLQARADGTHMRSHLAGRAARGERGPGDPSYLRPFPPSSSTRSGPSLST